MSQDKSNRRKTYVVEHLDPELEDWSALEYAAIAIETHKSGSNFLLSSVQQSLRLPGVQAGEQFQTDSRSVEDIFENIKHVVCLLDPAAQKELSPEDSRHFSVFLFGGILGKP
jgi:ribosome biogenesis SPOUT family RNA methylase Rps3